MKREEDIIRLADILARSFREELLPGEQEELDRWLDESEQHRRLYTRYAGEDFLKEKRAAADRIDWRGDYHGFIAAHRRRRAAGVWGRRMRYAAVLVLPLAVGLFWWLNSRGLREIPEVAATETVEQARPVLTLAGGRKIVLTDSVRLEEKDGTLVAGEAGKLAYRREGIALAGEAPAVVYNHLDIPRGAEYFLLLADNTKIWLNSESSIRYPVNFSGTTREVYIEGEAFFQVAEDTLHPFIVHAAESRIEVLGTEFNVRYYRDEPGIATTLVRGSVRLRSETHGDPVILKPGEQGIVRRADGGLTVEQVDTYLHTAWKDARFVFRRTRMEEILNTLARWYDLEIFYRQEAVKDIRFTGDMGRMADFRYLLNIIENNNLVRFTVSGRTVTVSSK